MARRKRRPVTRGWLTADTSVQVELERLAVDNVLTAVSSSIIDFDDLQTQEDAFATALQDDVADYYVEAIKGMTEFFTSLGVGNEFGAIQVAWGLLVGRTATFDDVASSPFPGLQDQPFWSQSFRANDEVRNVMRVNVDFAFETLADAGAAGYDTSKWVKHWATGPIHLKRGEGLYLVASQCGIEDNFVPWAEGDSMTMESIVSVLVREKRRTS